MKSRDRARVPGMFVGGLALAMSSFVGLPLAMPPTDADARSGRSVAVTADSPYRFPHQLSPDLPYDVNISALRQLGAPPDKADPPFDIADVNIPHAQRLFDIFSWQAFVALNWPALADGQPDRARTIAESGAPRVWEHFVEVAQVFRKDGRRPLPWAEAVGASRASRTFWMHGMGLGLPTERGDHEHGGDGGMRQPLLDESLQAFTGPLVDQEGKWVRYQVALNRTEFDYIVANKLHSLEGQAAYTARNQISFPTNDGSTKHGAIEIKMAWKQLGKSDDRGRFFVRRAKVEPLSGNPFEADFGLVGMHIAVRAKSSPSWIWATFEHVDNTSVNDLERDTNGRPRSPSFFNTGNPTIPVNVLAAKNAEPVAQFNPVTGQDDGPAVYTAWDEAKTTDPTQVIMVLPVPKATAELNRQVQEQLRSIGSVFQFYELIGTQWPVSPAFPGFPNGVATQSDGRLLPSSPESILFKVPGKVVPVHLVNTTMETFFQKGNQVAGPLAQDDRLPPGMVADPNTVFATESCAGCHFSAGACIGFKRDMHGRFLVQNIDGRNYRIPIFGQNAFRGANGNADYSWLLQLRAQSAPYTGADVVPLSQSGSLLPPSP